MKKLVQITLAFVFILVLGVSCKPKQSAYKQVYESAKEKEMQEAASQPTSVVKDAAPLPPVEVSVRKEKVEPVYHVVSTAIEAMEKVGVKPKVKPIRGGTDGARLSYMGLPCPNIFAGGENFHGKHEYVPVESMVKATEVILKIVELYEFK